VGPCHRQQTDASCQLGIGRPLRPANSYASQNTIRPH
jgi:hypothetical protein